MFEIITIISLAIIFIILLRRLPKVQIEEPAKKADLANQKTELAFGEMEITYLDEDKYKAHSLFLEAEKAMKQKDFKLAEKKLLKAVIAEPKNAKIYGKLGIVYLAQKNFADARDSFKMAIKYDPTNDFWYNDLGLAFFNLDEYQMAIAAFNRAIKIEEKVAARYINLGLVYESVGNQQKALDCYKKAISLEPDNDKYKNLIKEAIQKI